MTDAFSKFTAPRADEEIHQGSEVPVTFGISPTDGLPVPAMPDNQDRPPPLAVDTLVCMEDRRSFVIRNSDGSVWVSFEPSEVQRLPNGKYFTTIEVLRAQRPDMNFPRLGDMGVLGSSSKVEGRTVILVEPIRPICTHYLRMQTDISADRERRYLTRSCTAQRSETGEYYSVGDAAIYACSMRMPRHSETEQILEDFDTLSMQKSLERVKAGSFDVDAELAAEEAGGLGVLGSK
ncbi:MAG TPA: hypothetical protein VK571_07825 [Gemmatimonadaceae bacterium]|nr:hypothetical protein [Gemmatimonadaceae bacterium]